MKTQNYGNVSTWYGSDQLSSLMKKYAPNVNVLMSASVLLGLSKQLDQIGQNGQYFIPLNINCLSQNFEDGSRNDLQNNHWAGLYVVKDSNQTSVTYLDPMGKLINPQLVSEIRNKLGTNNIVQPLLNKPVQCVQLDPSGSFIEKGNDADCGPFLVYCVACMANSKAIRQDIKTLEQSASFGEYLRTAFSKETSFDEIYKAGNIAIEAPMKNKAAKEFEQYKFDEFKQWYTPQVVEYLTHLNSQDAFLRYVFFDKHPEDFKNQLESICAIKNFYGQSQKVKGISFISKEPGLGENHFVFGTFIGNKLIIINPVGETEHVNFYEALSEFKKVYKDIDVFLSNTILQKDSKLAGSGLVSCGPICIELMRHVSLLPVKKIVQLFETSTESSKCGLSYKEINIEKILPNTLNVLLNPSSGDDYITKVVEIRKSHNSILSEYSSLKNLKVEQQNELLDAQCTNHPMQRIVKIHVQDKGMPKTEIIDRYLQQGDKIQNISSLPQKPQKIYKLTEPVKALKDETNVITHEPLNKLPSKLISLPKIEEIKSEVARVLSLEATDFEKITQLKQIEETKYKPWIRELAYKKSVEEIKQLTIVLDDLGCLTTKLGELSSKVNDKLKYYTDAAVFYQYVISILKENEHLQKDREILESLKKDIADPYKQIDILQKKILSAVGGNIENISSASQETEANRNSLIILRQNTDKLLAKLEQCKEEKQNNPASPTTEQSLLITNAKGEQHTVVVTERKIFEYIANQMQGFLGKLYQDAEKQLPNKPEGCEYAVIGLGSMALKQMTPWSDLEFAIIINDHETKKKQEIITYLRNLTHLVHFKIINLSETVIPTSYTDTEKGSRDGVDMSHLVKVAVNFDLGGKTPLNRIDNDKQYDLIGTIDWLMQYVSNEGDKETKGEARDKALPYMLEKVCYVYGNKDLVKNYQGKVTGFLQEDYKGTEGEKEYTGLKQHQARALKVLKEGSQEFAYKDNTFKLLPKWPGDIDKLRPNLAEAAGRLFDVKQEIYRLPDRMVYNLGLYYGIEGDSAWDTIDKLQANKIINATAAGNLKSAVSFATVLRLKTYSYHKSQNDDMSLFATSGEELNQKTAMAFHLSEKDLEEDGVLFQYFYTALPLHQKLEKFCNGCKSLDQDKKEAFFQEESFYENKTISKGLIYYRLSQYTGAQLKLEAAVNDPENQDNLQIRSILGKIYISFGAGDKAIEQYLYRLEKDNDVAGSFHNLGGAHYSKGNYDQAIGFFTHSLEMKKLLYKKAPHPDIADSLMNLGTAYSSKGNYDQAIGFFTHSLEMKKLLYKKAPHPDIADSLMGLGLAYSYKGNYDQAIEYHTQSLEMNKLIYKEEPHPSIAASFHNLGLGYDSKGNYDQAIEYYTQSLVMRKLIYKGEPHPDITNSFNNLGNAYNSKGNYDQAIEYYTQNLEMNKLIYKEEPHPDIAKSFNNLGAAYYHKGNYNQAIEYHQRSLVMRKLVYKGEPHPDIADSFNNLGISCSSKGKYDQAIKYYTQSLEMNKLIYKGKPHPNEAAPLGNLGIAYYHKGNYDQAIEYHTQSLEMKKLIYKEEPHPVIAQSLMHLGLAYNSKGNYDQAIEYHTQSLEMNKLIYKEEPHPNIAKSFNNLGNAYYYKGNYDQAIDYHQRSLMMNKLIYKKEPHPDIAGCYNNLGNAYVNKGEYKQAHLYAQKALEVSLKCQTSQYISMPKTLYNLSSLQLGNLALLEDDRAKARECYKQIEVKYEQIDFTSEEHINLQLEYVGIAYSSKSLPAAINCQLVLLKVDPRLVCGNHYHNLGCFYACQGNVEEANKAFTNAFIHPNAQVTGGLHAEYAQFLIGNKSSDVLKADSHEITKHLYFAISSSDPGGLQYGKIEQGTVCNILQNLIKEKNDTISINPKVLAYYLLTTYPEYTREGDDIETLLESFRAYCDNLQDEIAFRLLSDAYKDNGYEEAAIKYVNCANVIDQVDKIISSKLKLGSDKCMIKIPEIENYAITLDKLALVAVSENRLNDVSIFYTKIFQIYDKVLTDYAEQLQLAANNLATFSLLTNNLEKFVELKFNYRTELNPDLIKLLGQDVDVVIEIEKQIIAQVEISIQQQDTEDVINPSETTETEVLSLGDNNKTD